MVARQLQRDFCKLLRVAQVYVTASASDHNQLKSCFRVVQWNGVIITRREGVTSVAFNIYNFLVLNSDKLQCRKRCAAHFMAT